MRIPRASLFGSIPLSLALAAAAHATPSSMLWTNATTDVQPFRTLHVGVDDYFRTSRGGASGTSAFPTDIGFTLGVLPGSKVHLEIGFDTLEPTDDPLSFNVKVGVPESMMFRGAPSFSIGIANFGTRRGVTDQDVVHAELGRAVPGGLRLFAGGYSGNRRVLRDPRGDVAASGILLACDLGLAPVPDASGAWNRLLLCGDWASGKNAIGGGGVGLAWGFARNVSLLTGPVWFNAPELNGDWKWTTQLDANVTF